MDSTKPNLTANLVQHLRGLISGGTIAPGEKLPSENALIEEHGVSRTVVREAITRLQAEGLVHTRRGAGSFALTPPSAETPTSHRIPRTLDERRTLLEYRMGLETEAAANAATRHQGHDLKAMDAALLGFERSAGHASRTMGCDYDFHLAVARASANSYFSEAIEGFGPAMIAMPRMRMESDSEHLAVRLAAVAGEHQAVRNAIAAGNPMAASAAMRVHLVNSLDRMLLEATQPPAR